MKPEQQRIAIAEACGYKPGCKCRLKQPRWRTPDDSGCCSIDELPNYLNDLNAMHEAEATLVDAALNKNFVDNLIVVILGENEAQSDGSYYEAWLMLQATAAQHAEAFLRTTGKWIED